MPKKQGKKEIQPTEMLPNHIIGDICMTGALTNPKKLTLKTT